MREHFFMHGGKVVFHFIGIRRGNRFFLQRLHYFCHVNHNAIGALHPRSCGLYVFAVLCIFRVVDIVAQKFGISNRVVAGAVK